MKTDFLKGLGLTEEQIKSVMAENGKDVNAEKEKTTKAETDLTNANTQLKTATDTITELKKNNTGNEDLQAKVTKYEEDIKTQKADYEAQIKKMKLDSAITGALSKTNAKHADLLASKIDRDKLVVNADGTVTGLDEQIKALKVDYKDLFEAKVSGLEPENHEESAAQVTKEDFAKMGYKERLELFNTNPDLYHELNK